MHLRKVDISINYIFKYLVQREKKTSAFISSPKKKVYRCNVEKETVIPENLHHSRNGPEFMKYNSFTFADRTKEYSPGHTLSYRRLWLNAVHNNQFRHTCDRFTI